MLARPFRAEWASAALPRRSPGLWPQDAGRVDPVSLLERYHHGFGGGSVVAGSGQPIAAAAHLTLEALQVTVGVTLHELLTGPGRCGRLSHAADLIGGRHIAGRSRRRGSRCTSAPGCRPG